MKIFRSSALAVLVTGLTASGLGTVSGLTSAQPAQAPAAVQQTPLTEQLDALLADPRFTGSQVGLVVRDASTGEELYDRNGGSRLLPASNIKLFTSAAAMDLLGPDFRFHTDDARRRTGTRRQAARRPVPEGVRRPDRAGVRLPGACQAGGRGGHPPGGR